MEKEPGQIVLDKESGMLLWQYEDGGCAPLEVHNGYIYVT